MLSKCAKSPKHACHPCSKPLESMGSNNTIWLEVKMPVSGIIHVWRLTGQGNQTFNNELAL
jgi:hypothetical protein